LPEPIAAMTRPVLGAKDSPERMKLGRELALTLDVDWAPDFVIEAVADLIRAAGVRSTWFVTHDSPALVSLRARPDLFELGIHPNFLPRSTQGGNVSEVLDHMMRLVPGAVSMRTHGGYQFSDLFVEVVTRTSIQADSSVFLPGHEDLRAFLLPLAQGRLVRVPYYWEDDVEMFHGRRSYTAREHLAPAGLMVFNFHPIHVFLNGADGSAYAAAKALGPLAQLKESELRRFVSPGEGPATMLRQLLGLMREQPQTRFIREIAADVGGEPEGQRSLGPTSERS
jgi:hypothetical protein